MNGMYCLLLLLVVMGVGSHAMPSSPFAWLDRAIADSNPSPGPKMHKLTVNCSDARKIVPHCRQHLWQLPYNGYPWVNDNNNTYRNQLQETVTSDTGKIRDPLDSLKHVCHILEKSERCLKESNVHGYCRETVGGMYTEADFDFICHERIRDENLVRSLQCLHDKRLLEMLYFHIASNCSGGMDMLDDIMVRTKNAYFYTLDINPAFDKPYVPQLYCLPKYVISGCIKDIVADHCGKYTAYFVQDYLVYIQGRFDEALQSDGLSSNICEHGIGSRRSTSNTVASTAPGKDKQFFKMLEMAAPGTALDTVYGKAVMAGLQRIPGREFCDPEGNANAAYRVCVLASDAKSARSNFNILQFAQQLVPMNYHGTQCNRLGLFTECWNLVQEICGSKVPGLAQHATLLTEGCKIQSEMDTAGCHWQDMLLGRYMDASQVTIWPTPIQCSQNPMNLGCGEYDLSLVNNDLDLVISLLEPGVEELQQRCGSRPAKRLRSTLQRLHRLQHDAMKYIHKYVYI